MSRVRALVVTGFGINTEEELAAAWRLAGADAAIVHLNDLFLERVRLADFEVLSFPGGFSFGDDLGSGKVLANKLKFKKVASGAPFREELRRFVAAGGFVLGVCNGFQALVKMGLLPNLGVALEQEATLTRNDSGKFEDRWVECAVNPRARTPFLADIGRLRLPVRHGEGKLLLRDDAVRRAVVDGALDCLHYCDARGEATAHYPENPNGAELACAGLVDRSGRVLGMMPHPEAYLSAYNDPCWPEWRRSGRLAQQGEAGAGLQIFRNLVEHLEAGRGSPRAAGEGGR